MTEQFQDRLLEYLNGDLTIQNPNDDLQYRQFDNNLDSDIYTQLATLNNYVITGTTNDINNNFVIFYGYYQTNKGFILLADYNFKTIQLFTTYEGGTNLPIIYYLTYAEDGTFYGITKSSTTLNMTMFNNFCLTLTGTYSVKYRQQYALDGNLQNAHFEIKGAKIFKRVNSAEYILIAPLTISSSTITQTAVSRLKVNVGSSNEWVHMTYTTDFIYASSNYDGFQSYASWTGDNYYTKFGGVLLSSANYYYKEYKASNGGATSSYTTTMTVGNLYQLGIGGIIMTSYDTTYLGTSLRTTTPSTYNIYNITSGTTTQIYTAEDYAPSGYSSYFILNYTNNQLMFAASAAEGFYGGNSEGRIGLVINNKAYEIARYISNIFEFTGLFMQSQFNLKNFYTYSPGYFEKYTLTYNETDYLGTDYENVNSMIPQSGIVYDDDGKIVFARNLYNKTISGNITESTIEIPNKYLNDITMGSQELISETNSTLNSNTQTIEKNIYETVYLNFFNKLLISNQNDPDNIIENLDASNRLNNSISSTKDYTDAQIKYIRINYQDGTHQNLTNYDKYQLLDADNKIYYKYHFKIYVSKLISNIQFVSSDENTVYQTINSTFEYRKSYDIVQDVRIEIT